MDYKHPFRIIDIPKIRVSNQTVLIATEKLNRCIIRNGHGFKISMPLIFAF
jgi:hypothetical protein